MTFEFLEYSLEHQLNNFSECWWDHWILDVLICNGGGTIAGIYTLRWLRLKVIKKLTHTGFENTGTPLVPRIREKASNEDTDTEFILHN